MGTMCSADCICNLIHLFAFKIYLQRCIRFFFVTIFEKYTRSRTVEVYLVISLISGALYLKNSAE